MSDEIKGSIGPDNIFRLEPESRARLLAEQSEITRELDDKHFFETCEDNGYYTLKQDGSKNLSQPNYGAILRRFDHDHPHKTIADMKAVYIFRGTHYEEFTPIEIKAFAETKFKPCPKEMYRNEFLNKVLATNVATRKFFSTTTEDKINFRNGILDMSKTDGDGKLPALLPHSPRYGFRHVLPFEYDPSATCPQFEAWIKDVMLNRPGLIYILQEFAGYIVRSGEYKHHKALWLSGSGRNGKSTFLDILKGLIGDDNYSVLSITELIEEKFLRAELDGKIANFSEETGPDDLHDAGSFKNLTGDGQLEAQKKYGQPFKFRNRAKLVMTFNEMPALKDLTPGMRSRLMIIPWEKDLTNEADQDKGLKKRLLGELPGIFNWALRGWERLEFQGGFSKAEESTAELNELALASCSVAQWAADNVRLEPLEHEASFGRQELDALYKRYREWQKEFPYSPKRFKDRLSQLSGFSERRKKSGGIRYYICLSFKSDQINF